MYHDKYSRVQRSVVSSNAQRRHKANCVCLHMPRISNNLQLAPPENRDGDHFGVDVFWEMDGDDVA